MDMLGDAKQQIGNAKLSIDKNFILYTNQTTGLDTEKIRLQAQLLQFYGN